MGHRARMQRAVGPQQRVRRPKVVDEHDVDILAAGGVAQIRLRRARCQAAAQQSLTPNPFAGGPSQLLPCPRVGPQVERRLDGYGCHRAPPRRRFFCAAPAIPPRWDMLLLHAHALQKRASATSEATQARLALCAVRLCVMKRDSRENMPCHTALYKILEAQRTHLCASLIA